MNDMNNMEATRQWIPLDIKEEAPAGMRWCLRCGNLRTLGEMLSNQCKDCRNKDRRDKRAKGAYTVFDHRPSHYRRTYGIEMARYDSFFAAQDGKCAICHQASTRNLALDHDHTSGRIRGLLCIGCNTVLGHSKDSIQVLEAAINYLKAGGINSLTK